MSARNLPGKLVAAGIGGCLLLAVAVPSLIHAQSPDAGADWEKAAGGKLSFEAASVKENNSPLDLAKSPPRSNFELGIGDKKPPNGVLTAMNINLENFIFFAYKLHVGEGKAVIAELPQWARNSRFDVEARPPGSNFTADQVRLMMQSLLAERFKLTAHFESKEGPAYALVLAKAGKLGPQMRAYPDGVPCSDTQPSVGSRGAGPTPLGATVNDGRFPASCGEMVAMTPSEDGLIRQGGRDISIDYLLDFATIFAQMDHSLVDRTGLNGAFDVSVEFAIGPPGSNATAGATFQEALKDQLGLKLEPITAPVRTLIIDHVEEPTPN